MAAYKKTLKENLEKAKQTTQKAIAIFFDPENSKADRLGAFGICGTFNAAADIKRALTVFRDPNEDPAIRASALQGLINYATGNEEFIDELIGLLNTETAATELKEATLSVLHANTFSSSLLTTKRPDYMNALKNLVESDAAKKLQLRATEYLAIEKDEYIQRKLLSGLENPEESFVKPEIAIQLLSYDLHADHYPTLRKIAEASPNKKARKEALRNLAADQESASLLEKILNDKDEDEEIRHVSAVGLQSMEPDVLQNSLKGILTDNTENPILQAALLNTLNYSDNTELIDEDEDFQEKLEHITQETRSRNLKKTYKSYVAKKSKK